MQTVQEIKALVCAALPDAAIELQTNPCPSAQHALIVDRAHAFAAASFLKETPGLRFDYASNVTGVDWPERTVVEKKREKQLIDGVEREIEHTTETKIAGFLEVVYHLYSMELRHGPLVLKVRTGDRSTDTHVPSLTPLWRGAEFQEREIFDLYGVVFEGHPDLRRILMWDGFKDFPMRKDYVEPDDYEYEPTAHDDVREKANRHPGAKPAPTDT